MAPWLPLHANIRHQLLVLASKAIHSLAPLISHDGPARGLWSSSNTTLLANGTLFSEEAAPTSLHLGCPLGLWPCDCAAGLIRARPTSSPRLGAMSVPHSTPPVVSLFQLSDL